MSLPDATYYSLFSASTERYGLMDIAYGSHPGYFPGRDTRAHRLVLQKHNEQTWLDFWTLMIDGYNRETARKEKERKEKAEKWQGDFEASQRQREAEQARVDREELGNIQPVIDATAGQIHSDLATTAFIPHDVIRDYGESIEDIVDAYQGHGGFLTTTSKATDTKLQISVSLDLSNSMYYNNVHQVAAEAFLTVCMSLKAIRDEYPDDVYISFFTFSEDGWEGIGKRVRQLEERDTSKAVFGEFDFIKPNTIRTWTRANYNAKGIFTGEDTYIAPLLKELEEWENKHSDPGAIKLDVVITDAVFEHPKDIRESDAIQEHRNGQLQTVFLNFMNETNWLGSTLPKRSVMVKVDKDNLSGILRNLVSEFLGACL
jgi:hypothetical protein